MCVCRILRILPGLSLYTSYLQATYESTLSPTHLMQQLLAFVHPLLKLGLLEGPQRKTVFLGPPRTKRLAHWRGWVCERYPGCEFLVQVPIATRSLIYLNV